MDAGNQKPGKELVAYGPPLQGVMPKEEELLSIIKSELNQNRKVMVYYQNSNTTDISPRIVAMLPIGTGFGMLGKAFDSYRFPETS